MIVGDGEPAQAAPGHQLANENLDEGRHRAARARVERHAILTSLGMKRVKGALGGTYYE